MTELITDGRHLSIVAFGWQGTCYDAFTRLFEPMEV